MQVETFSGLKSKIASWHPMNPLLIADPGASTFLPPPCVDIVSGYVMTNLRRRTIMASAIWGLFLAAACYVWIARQSSHAAGLAVFGLLAILMTGTDYVVYLRHRCWLCERAMFFYWLQRTRRARTGLVVWLCAGAILGATQLLIQHRLGGLSPLVERLGLLYPMADAGQVWRLLVGPFFHASAAHFLNNLFVLCYIGPIAWAIFGPKSTLVFVLGVWCGAGFAWLFHNAGYDSYLGVSGGVYALFGYLIASSFRDRSLLPRGFAVNCAWLVGILLTVAQSFSSNVSHISHWAGLLLGAVLAMASTRCLQCK